MAGKSLLFYPDEDKVCYFILMRQELPEEVILSRELKGVRERVMPIYEMFHTGSEDIKVE